jgi:DNA primase
MKEKILARITLKDFVGLSIKLDQKGPDQYLGLCPFHQEKTPSFSIKKNFFRCFGCGVSGDLIKFLMLKEKITYQESIKRLAKAAGLEGDLQNFQDIKLEANNLFAKLCQDILLDPKYHYGLDYFKLRQLNLEIIELYKLGYLAYTKSDWLFQELSQNFSPAELLELGLFKLKEARYYSPFVGRVLFPISEGGTILGFGSRLIGEETGKAKYLNSSDSNFFHKSQLLYGFDQVKVESNLFIVEGYMDVLALAKEGIRGALGILGANFTSEQLRKAWQISDRPILLLDNDEAGQKAMAKAAKMAISQIETGKSLAFLKTPKGKDPDEFLQEEGGESLIALAANPTNLADYLIEITQKEIFFTGPDAQALLEKKLLELAKEIKDEKLSNSYKNYYTQIFKKNSYKKVVKAPIIQQKSSNIIELEKSEEMICHIIKRDPSLLLEQRLLDLFISCKFISKKADKMRLDLTKNLDQVKPKEEKQDKKALESAILLLQIREVQEEMSQVLLEEASFVVENKLMQLKLYEMELQSKLANILL